METLTLAQWLKSNGVRQADFAETVGRTQATISRLVGGEAQPSAELAARIEQATGGQVPFWTWEAFAAFMPKDSEVQNAR
jgi:plasmid maintenance system antidote protein VapI